MVGFDDLEPAAWADPPLTTVRQDVEEMGRLMAQLLLRLLDREKAGTAEGPDAAEPAPIITEARLVVREST